MSGFFFLLALIVLCTTGLVGGFMVALSMPESKMRDVCLQVFGVAVAILCALWFVMPDPLPIVVDDLAAIVVGLTAAIQASRAGKRNERRIAA